MKRHVVAAAILPAGGFAVILLFVAIVIYPMANSAKSGRAFAGIIAAETAVSRAAGHQVMAFALGNLPIHYAFYTDGIYTRETSDTGELIRHLQNNDRVWVVADATRLNELPGDLRSRIEIVATTHASRKDVALVANRPAD